MDSFHGNDDSVIVKMLLEPSYDFVGLGAILFKQRFVPDYIWATFLG